MRSVYAGASLPRTVDLMDATLAPAPVTTTTPPPAVSTAALLTAMLQVSPNVSDLIFSPGKPSQVELSGKLMGIKVGSLGVLTAADTQRSQDHPSQLQSPDHLASLLLLQKKQKPPIHP